MISLNMSREKISGQATISECKIVNVETCKKYYIK